ncbi:MAG: zinc ribbon domain-containing protein [Pyrinomonadaceae bacterium]|nr:zinc ribbon domain-containing protein [Pyrinomonadaceae bacterium]
MFCPKCGSKNLDDAKFCRACGVDISLMSEALTGQLAKKPTTLSDIPQAPMMWDWGCDANGKRGKQPSLDKAITNVFMAVAFLLVATSVLIFAPGGRGWWFYMLIPASALLGTGVAEIVRLKQARRSTPDPVSTSDRAMPTSAFTAAPQANELPPRNTSEIFAPPPSITESTTRHLDPQVSVFEKVPAGRSGENR